MVLKLIDKVKFLLRILSCVTVCTLTIIIGIQVVNRYVFGTSFTWVEELAGMAMVYITYFGAAMATINNSNTRIDFFIRKLPGPVYRGFEILDDCICIAFLLVICRYAAKLVEIERYGVTVAMVNRHVTENRLADIAGKTRNVPENCDLLTVARRMGISLG